MIAKLNESIEAYQTDWYQLVNERADQAFFSQLVPVSIGWKVDSIEAFDAVLAELRPHCDQVHMIHKNDRWLATLHLKDQPLVWNIDVVNLMVRRPDSNDALGIDNISFYVPHFARTEEVLALEPQIKWTRESNGAYSNWLSLWFAHREAKLRAETTLDVTLHELRALRDEVMEGKK